MLFCHPICQHVSVTSFDHNNRLVVPCACGWVDHRQRQGCLSAPLVCLPKAVVWLIQDVWEVGGAFSPTPKSHPSRVEVNPIWLHQCGLQKFGQSSSITLSSCDLMCIVSGSGLFWDFFDISDLWRFSLDYLKKLWSHCDVTVDCTLEGFLVFLLVRVFF